MTVRSLSIVGAVGILMVGGVGCSTDGSSSDATTTSTAATATSAATTTSAAAAGTGAKVTIDGQAKQVDGPVVCSTTDGKFSIAIGEVITGVIVGLEQDASKVRVVGLGDINGVVLNFTDGVPGDTATATKDGNTYTIKGTASGSDSAGNQVSKPFEVVATCP
ncbi:lipoprotein LpqH [Mycolicibacterium psychrotolerans]|uniref:lipoprotein LpqH n=1 Tax=Mycolicibacterium psychrotolerans TaxID=216929 RepID=UPI003D673822